jgi:predicted esterase
MKSGRFLLTVFFLLIAVVQAYPQSSPTTYSEGKYGKLIYGLFIPENYDESKQYPVVVYLHGFGNNEYVYLDWYKLEIQSKTPCFVFTPRTPTTWADWSGWNNNKLSEPMVAAIHVLDSLTSVYSIDKNRLYVYGISMGGEGVFDLLHKLPGKFAAAMSVCGGGQASWAENISKTPLWMFHGSADDVNPPDLTERVYNRLVEIGASKMRYTNYHGYGHDIWNLAESEPSWFDWMFSHSKAVTNCNRPNKTIILKGTLNNQIELRWNDVRNASDKANKIWYYQVFNRDTIFATVEFDKTQIIIDPAVTKGPFRVVAVNYCFEKSEPSNAVEFKK